MDSMKIIGLNQTGRKSSKGRMLNFRPLPEEKSPAGLMKGNKNQTLDWLLTLNQPGQNLRMPGEK